MAKVARITIGSGGFYRGRASYDSEQGVEVMRVLGLCGFLVFVTCLAITLFFARRLVRY
jgi:hypothetical protein